jgi:hypothetical protein
MFRTLVGSVALVLLAGPSLLADELRTLGGKTVTGTLAGIDASEITLKTDAGPVATPLSQVLGLDLRKTKEIPAGVRFTDVRLLDDSVLHCQSVTFKGNDVDVTLLSGAQVKLPISFLAWIVQDAQNVSLRKKFDEVLAQKSRRDRIVILRDMELNALEGTLGDVDAKGTSIDFRRDGADAIAVLFERVHGLIFYRTEVSKQEPLCRVYDIDGNSLVAVKLAVADTDSVVLTTSFDAKVSLKKDTLARLDFNIGKLTFLSDMEPVKVVERSGIGLVTPYRKDANLDGEPILLEKQHAKGLSMHAHTELSYNLAGKYKEFKARLGVDIRTGNDSHALVTVYCDGEKRFSEVVSPKGERDIALSVKDVSTLRIVVSSRNILDLHDHATLADARVSQ